MAKPRVRVKPPTKLQQVERQRAQLEPKLKTKKAEAKDLRDRQSLADFGRHYDDISNQAKRAERGQSFDPNKVREAVRAGAAPKRVVINKNGQVAVKTKHALVHLPSWMTHKPDTYVPNPKTGLTLDDIQVQQAATTAPVIKVLEQTTRAKSAIAGGVDAAVTGKNVVKGVSRGATKNDIGFGEVLKHLGAPKSVQKIGGATGDIFIDPVTYATGGTGAIATHAAEGAAIAAAKQAAKTGAEDAARAAARRSATSVTRKEAARAMARAQGGGDPLAHNSLGATVSSAAAKRAEAAAPEGSGIAVKFAGKEVPGVRRGTAAVGRKVPKVKTPETVRNVRPGAAPAGADKDAYRGARQAARSSRATRNRAEMQATGQAQTLHQAIPAAQMPAVIHAVETGTIGKLPPELRKPAARWRDSNRGALKVRRRAGQGGDVTKGAAKGYVSHAQDTPLKQGLGIVEKTDTEKVYGTSAKDQAAKKRRDTRPIAVQNPERIANGQEPFSTDIPLLHANYVRGTGRVVANANLHRDLAATGRPVRVITKREKDGSFSRFLDPKATATRSEHEDIYHLGTGEGGYKLRPVDPDKPLPKGGKFAILDRRNLAAAEEYGKGHHAESTIGKGFDKVTGFWKRTSIATPAYHLRNAPGDLDLLYKNQPGHRLFQNVAQGIKATHALNKRRAAIARFDTDLGKDGQTVKLAGKPTRMSEFLDRAERHGVVQSGAIGGELSDLASKSAKDGVKAPLKDRSGKRVVRLASGAAQATKAGGRAVGRTAPGRAVKAAGRAVSSGRENALRLAAFKHGLDKGMTDAEAADFAMQSQIDYADLTPFERGTMRRVAPFYTFSARALPFLATRLVTNPGKYATLEKLRESASDGDSNHGKDLSPFSEYTQRNVPVVIGGKAYTISPPEVLLNELPTTTSPGKYLGELSDFGASMLNPILKVPIELKLNQTFAFRQPIQGNSQNNYPTRVAAPDWVGHLSPGLQKKMGVAKIRDKRTGKMVWGWPGRTQYIVRQALPGVLGQLNNLTATGTNSGGQSRGQLASGYLTGVRVTPGDKSSQTINDLYAQLNKITDKQHDIGQRLQRNGAKSDAKLIRQLADLALLQRDTEREIYKMSTKRGDKNPAFAPAARRESAATAKGLGGGLGGGGLGGGLGGGF